MFAEKLQFLTSCRVYRASMSKSSMLFSKTVAPQSVFPLFALKQRDFRLNFCVNNGSASMASCVPIYRAETLDRQLDEVSLRSQCSLFCLRTLALCVDDITYAQ
jgi:hypothetical protein